MTLSEFAVLVGAPPKWILNAKAAIGGKMEYTNRTALRLSVAHAINSSLGITLERSWQLAGDAAASAESASGQAVTLATRSPADDTVAIVVDLPRLVSAFHARRSLLATTLRPRQPGRPRRPRNPIRAADEYGLDLSLLSANLRRSHAERLRQLDGMAAFRRNVRRASPA